MGYFLQKRLVKTFYLILFLFLPLLVHLGVIQLIHGDEYNTKALDQRSLKVAMEEIPRGQVLDRYGVNSLNRGEKIPRIVLYPQVIKNKEEVIEQLSTILGCATQELAPYFTGTSGFLSYRLNQTQITAIKNLKIPGLMVEDIYFRYGETPLASHVVGHLGRISEQDQLEQLNRLGNKKYTLSDLIGKTGLEYYYEAQLKADEPASITRAYVDVYRNLISGLGIQRESTQDTGRQDVVTTLDIHIQQVVEKIMAERVERGAVVVMDAGTGDLLALASRPNFNPANVSLYLPGDEDTFLDQCTALYQPGSIFKMVVAAAALEEKIVKPTDTFVCLGGNDHLINCWHKTGHGPITFEEAFAESCNPVFVELGLKLGAEKLIRYARAFGLESQDIIGYPVPKDKRQQLDLIAQPYNLVNSSIGQGPVLTTPVQLTAMLNTIVNNGVYIKPRMVKGIKNEKGKYTQHFSMGESRKVISNETAKELQRLLGLVTTQGVGKEAFVTGFGSAGKTGSAEIFAESDKVNAWFVGYAPYEKPKYIVTVLVKEGVSGGVSAAPVFRQIVEEILLPSH
ncbi:peptidoglycan D,D-transpeptidase FtsI family protein [Desulfotomaculum sp. 1211_IL3151]|uniref:peptidoglycan D,D-transpeptidase FtsI family protein n=1 Tax=Desulfotomaculum sp. 1211_IL3151 TaxID=3084055 RepID=UPI002FD9F848